MDYPTENRASRDRDPAKLRAELHRLDRRDWWRWAAAISIMLLTTLGVFVLSLPGLRRSWQEQQQLDIAVLGLFGAVLLFDVFSVYQQSVINRMRRELAADIGLALGCETTRATEARSGDIDQRQNPRHALDQRLIVRATINGKQVVVHGRTSDISMHGLGAVIPESLAPGTEVVLEMALGEVKDTLQLNAVVCHQRGFVHGFQFTSPTLAQREAILRACSEVPELESSRDF